MPVEGLPEDFAALLRSERSRIVPFIGAGLSIEAGVRDLTDALARAAAERGLQPGQGLRAACEALESGVGIEETRQIVAEEIGSLEITPTPTYRALARVPAGILVTANYDNGAELAAEQVGLRPHSILPNTAAAFQPPAEDELLVVHLHGIASEPESIILPGSTTDALRENQRFRTFVRGLWASHRVVYLGFSFGIDETHLRDELEWMAEELEDAPTQKLLIPEGAARERGGEVAALTGTGMIELVEYPAAPNHPAVHQCALVLAPSNEPAPDHVTRAAPRPNPHFRDPPLLEAEWRENESATAAQVFAAELGIGEVSWVEPEQLAERERAVVVASPGMGKTELLRRVGAIYRGHRRPLFVTMKSLPSLLEGGEEARGFARLVADAGAYDAETPIPNIDRLQRGSFLFLLDGLDEMGNEEREQCVTELINAQRRWPQHGFLVSSRPHPAVERLLDHDFELYRIAPSPQWGRGYLRDRGIREEAIEEALRAMPEISALIGHPVYAAGLGERLSSGQELPSRPLDLIIDQVKSLAAREALQRAGVAAEDYLEWLYRLAVALELRGLSTARVEEMRTVPGPEGTAEATRERLIEMALLRDVPGVAALPTKLIQEALCADAVLGAEDVRAALEYLAATELSGEWVLRGDIDNTLELVFANATSELRQALRSLDPLRWARTLTPGAGEEEAREALREIWDWHRTRRIWIDALEAPAASILSKCPALLEEMREELVEATRSEEATLRGNALELLVESGDETARDWLPPLLSDENPVVRRRAGVAVARLKVREAMPVLKEQLPAAHDEARAYAQALVQLADDAEMDEVLQLIVARPGLLGQVAEKLMERMTAGVALSMLPELPERDGRVDLLVKIVEAKPAGEWNEQDVEAMAAAMVSDEVQPGESQVAPLTEIVARHPAAALAGARRAGEGLDGTVLWPDLYFLRGLPRELLEAEVDGPIGSAFRALLQNLEAEREPREETTGGRERQRIEMGRRDDLGSQLESGEISAERAPTNPSAIQVDGLNEAQRELLSELVEAWWPAEGIGAALEGTDDRTQTAAAVCAAAALDRPPSGERWLEVFSSGAALALSGEVSPWMCRHSDLVDTDEAAAALRTAEPDEWHLYYATGCFFDLPRPVAEVIASRLPAVRQDPLFEQLLGRLSKGGHGDLLGEEVDTTPERRKAARESQAAAGDAESQLELTAERRTAVEKGMPAEPIEWAASVEDDSVIAALGELLELLGPSSGRPGDLQASVVRALAATGSEAALHAYDRLIAGASFEAAFFWYPRQELAREMATRIVLDRLPQELVGASQLLSPPQADCFE